MEQKGQRWSFLQWGLHFYLHLFSLIKWLLNVMERLASFLWAMEAGNSSHWYIDPSSEQNQPDPTATPGNPQLAAQVGATAFYKLGSHGQAPGGWCWNSHAACRGHYAGPRKRQRPGACPGAGEHWPLPSHAHLALAMRMQHFFRWAVLLRVEDTYSASINLSVFSLPV